MFLRGTLSLNYTTSSKLQNIDNGGSVQHAPPPPPVNRITLNEIVLQKVRREDDKIITIVMILRNVAVCAKYNQEIATQKDNIFL